MTGVELIAAERERQIRVEGWSEEHDDQHETGELSSAAECYVAYASDQLSGMHPTKSVPLQWPWAPDWWKPSVDLVRNLQKAGALIAAEIDRLQRKAG